MAHYFKRSFISERLRVSVWQSYKIIGASWGSRISTANLAVVLNRAKRGMGEERFDDMYVPHDLLKPDELAAELAGSQITEHELLCWTRRTRPEAVPPHFRFSKRTIRFPRSKFMEWLDARSQLKTLKVRKA